MFVKFLPSKHPKAPQTEADFEEMSPILSLDTVIAIMPDSDEDEDGNEIPLETALVILQKEGVSRQFRVGNNFLQLQNFLREHRLLIEPKNNQ